MIQNYHIYIAEKKKNKKLRKENEELKYKIEVLEKEIKFLKEKGEKE